VFLAAAAQRTSGNAAGHRSGAGPPSTTRSKLAGEIGMLDAISGRGRAEIGFRAGRSCRTSSSASAST